MCVKSESTNTFELVKYGSCLILSRDCISKKRAKKRSKLCFGAFCSSLKGIRQVLDICLKEIEGMLVHV